MSKLSPDTIRKLLRYNPKSGKLYWLPRPIEMFKNEGSFKSWNTKNSNKEALTADNGDGYKKGRILGRLYRAHRVIWAMVNGDWPDGGIDHINGVKGDNRICNLRSVSHAENMKNQRIRINNTSGHIGVAWHKRDMLWVSTIYYNDKSIYLGGYSDIEDAIYARKKAEIKYGFHENHGRVS